jgi:hypothetical protein
MPGAALHKACVRALHLRRLFKANHTSILPTDATVLQQSGDYTAGEAFADQSDRG